MAIQLREFAERVLFGTTIEEKLGFPREEIIDTQPGDPIKTPRSLTRPNHLKLREDGVRANHPKASKLIDERERGRLLHFFGNHELLATELMALAILKFPDAPQSFRQGLLETLKDEQIHTRIYMHRMQQCGVDFGELPLSDYFWKSVSSMHDPLDYVTRLSLTFEQANLDYSREYGKIFQEVGDIPTASILEKIYRDEIDHVGFGLRWFRKWKDSGKSDWEVFRERLVFPLSPSRAKGNDFNVDGRKAAGLDEAFINDLKLYNQSRGRTPTVHWFNPDAERFASQNSTEIKDGPPGPLQSDLAFLPAYLAKQGDIVLLPQLPSRTFLETLQSYGFTLPETITYSTCDSPAIDRKLGHLSPWAWTPDSIDFFRQAAKSLTRHQNLDTRWSNEIRQLHSKAFAAQLGKTLSENLKSETWIAPTETYAELAYSIEQLLAIRENLQRIGYSNTAFKAPFSTAAGGIRCLMKGESPSPAFLNWAKTTLQMQKSVLVEPWLDRVFDFSLQLDHQGETTKLIAYTRLKNNARGQFQGIITNAFTLGLPQELIRFMMERRSGKPRLYQLFEQELIPLIENRLNSSGYTGNLGIDAFIYRSPQGELRLKPLIEINARTTMGRVAVEISKRLASGSVGLFQIQTKSQLKKNGYRSFVDFVSAFAREFPITLNSKKLNQIESGSFALTDPSQAQQFLSLFHARKEFAQLPIT